ncbi:MAG TPA: hypothetical protein VNK43_01365 [Gemmatimonadales bacterium]|nr:hypothetical protein [Gemmatimonadales bacterium]
METVGQLQVEEDPRFTRREWRLQRVGWIAMLAVALAGLVGLAGRGPLSSATAGEPAGALAVRYERIVRHEAPTQLRIRLGPGVARKGRVRVVLDRGYLEGVEIEWVLPEPAAVAAAADRFIYDFAIAEPDRAGEVVFGLRPDRLWRRRARVGLERGPAVEFTQLVLP